MSDGGRGEGAPSHTAIIEMVPGPVLLGEEPVSERAGSAPNSPSNKEAKHISFSDHDVSITIDPDVSGSRRESPAPLPAGPGARFGRILPSLVSPAALSQKHQRNLSDEVHVRYGVLNSEPNVAGIRVSAGPDEFRIMPKPMGLGLGLSRETKVCRTTMISMVMTDDALDDAGGKPGQ
jgi:hypothetical protein